MQRKSNENRDRVIEDSGKFDRDILLLQVVGVSTVLLQAVGVFD